MADTDVKILIKQSSSTGTISAGDEILQSGELAYSYAAGDSDGGLRLFIGTGGGNGYASDVHTIGGKYFTDMLDHPKGQLNAKSAIVTDANNKINKINIDNITIDGDTITNTVSGITIAGAGPLSISDQRITDVGNPTSNQDVATKYYVDNKNIMDVGANTNISGTGEITTGDQLLLQGGFNFNTTRQDISSGVRVKFHLDSDVLGLSSLQVDNVTVDGNTITATSGQLNLTSTSSNVVVQKDLSLSDEMFIGDNKAIYFNGMGKIFAQSGQFKIQNTTGDNTVRLFYGTSEKIRTTNTGVNVTGNAVISGNLQVDGTTTTINSTELTVDDKNITLASGAVNAAAADSAGIHVDGANADIYYDAPTDTWNFNKNVSAPNIDVDGNITIGGSITAAGGYEGFDSDFAQKTTSDLTEGTNLYYTTTRFDTRLATKTTADLTEGSNLYFTNERVDDRIYNLLRPGEGIDFSYNDAGNEFDISCEFASINNPGIAKFDSQDFLVTAGNVEIATIDCGTF